MPLGALPPTSSGKILRVARPKQVSKHVSGDFISRTTTYLVLSYLLRAAVAAVALRGDKWRPGRGVQLKVSSSWWELGGSGERWEAPITLGDPKESSRGVPVGSCHLLVPSVPCWGLTPHCGFGFTVYVSERQTHSRFSPLLPNPQVPRCPPGKFPPFLPTYHPRP
jgi:hypothetical protein